MALRSPGMLWMCALVLITEVRVPTAAGQIPQFRSGVDLVNLGVTVTDRKGNLVTDLEAEDFELYEDGKRQTIRLFAAGDLLDSDHGAPPMHLGLVLDASESMERNMAFTKTAAVRFFKRLADAVDITVIDFDTEVRAARYSQANFARLVERIRQQKAAGSTALYDAIGLYLEGAAGLDGRKIMLLYTDGGDNHSSLSFHALVDLLKASDTTVYAIGELEHEPSWTQNDARLILQQIAGATGGQTFFPQSLQDLDKVYDEVLAEIRAQYTLGFVSTNDKTDGTWRKVEIKITRKGDHRVRARKGYFAAYKKP